MLRKLRIIALLLVLMMARQIAVAQTMPNDPVALADRMINLEIEPAARYIPVKDLVDIDPEMGFAVLRDNWTKIRSADAKQSLINTFLCATNPHMVEIIHLGATDPNLAVQTYAMRAAETLEFRPLSEDYNVYMEWHKAAAGKTLLEVLNPGVQSFVARFRAATSAEREPMLQFLTTIQFSQPTKISRLRRKAILDAGVLEPLAKALTPQAGAVSNQDALQFASILRPDGAFLRTSILPLAGKDSPLNLRYMALSLLGSADNSWASEPLLKMLVDEYPDQIVYQIGAALGAIGDPHVIPTLIGMLDADNTREGMFQIGNVLAQVTGVLTLEGHDSAWWHQWLAKNKMRLPPDVREMPVPKVALRKRQPGFENQFQEPNRAELRHANADPHSAYWLIIPNNGRVARFNNFQGNIRVGQAVMINGVAVANPAGAGGAIKTTAPGLLVVLTAGDGSGGNAVELWKDIAHTVFKDHYLIALPVAPRWDADQKITWLTAENKKDVKQAKFTTETLVADIVKDVTGTYAPDPSRIFLHGTADSGPAVYAASLEPSTPFKGFYLLSAPFKSAGLPLKLAKGRRYLLQNSKEDKANPYLMATAAQKILSDNGASAKLLPFRGKGAYDFEEGREKAMNDAMNWLETGK